MKKFNLSSSYTWIVMAFLYAPIFVLIVFSFNESKSRALFTGFTLDWYKNLFNNEQILSALANTLIIAAIASVFSTIVGSLAAVGIHNMGKKLKSAVLNLTYLPIINPEIVTGVSLMLLFVFLRDNLTIPVEMGFITLTLAHITFCIPYVILNVLPKLRQLDEHIYFAAVDLGCPPVQAFLKVVMPQIMPGVLSGFLMAFTYSLDDFVISYFVTGARFQTLPVEIYSMARRKVSPEINALSTIFFVVVLTVLIASNYFEAKKIKNKSKYD